GGFPNLNNVYPKSSMLAEIPANPIMGARKLYQEFREDKEMEPGAKIFIGLTIAPAFLAVLTTAKWVGYPFGAAWHGIKYASGKDVSVSPRRAFNVAQHGLLEAISSPSVAGTSIKDLALAFSQAAQTSFHLEEAAILAEQARADT